MAIQVGDVVTYGGIECVVVYDAGSQQSWGRYILCEKWDLNHYEPDLGTGGVEESYSGKQWGIYGQDDSGANGTAIGTGKDNTDYLIGRYNSDTYLWYYVNQHRTKTNKDWCVPSTDELNILYENRTQIGNFFTSRNPYYWSSSEYSSDGAWGQYIVDGSQVTDAKNITHFRVRLVTYVDDLRNITITCATDGASIHYTLDGNNPTEESVLYSGPIEVAPSTVVKAKAYKDGMMPSETAMTTIS